MVNALAVCGILVMAAARMQGSPSGPETLAVTHRMRGLIACRRAEVIAIFSTLLREIWIEPEKCDSVAQALHLLSGNRFEALVLDFDDLAGCAEISRSVRKLRPNQDICILAIASNDQNKETALAAGSTFVIDQNLDQRLIRDALRNVRNRMLRSLEAHFRLKIDLPVSIVRASGTILECATINLSQNGMAVSTPVRLESGEKLRLMFILPPGDDITNAEGTVIWEDGNGNAGIQFACANPSAMAKYHGWLHCHLHLAAGTAPGVFDRVAKHRR